VVIGLAVTLGSTASFALGSDSQRAACTPDVFRLCSSEIPNVDRIVACLKKEKPNLSAGCQAVFNTTEEKSATRSIATPALEWCTFNSHVIDPGETDWFKWCGTAAGNQ
jgi:hypothetical protein